MSNFFPLHRKILDWEWFTDSTVTHLFIYCLLKANETDTLHQGNEVKRGSFITTLKDISQDTNLTLQQTRTALNKLKSTHNLTNKSTNKFTIITICKYDTYNDNFKEGNININKQLNKRTTNKTEKINKQNSPKKVSFKDSEIYDLKAFSDAFPDWSKEQKRYYFDAASSYSDEGNKYINWKSAISNWALRDQHNQRNYFFKKTNFKNEPNTIITGRKDYSDWLED